MVDHEAASADIYWVSAHSVPLGHSQCRHSGRNDLLTAGEIAHSTHTRPLGGFGHPARPEAVRRAGPMSSVEEVLEFSGDELGILRDEPVPRVWDVDGCHDVGQARRDGGSDGVELPLGTGEFAAALRRGPGRAVLRPHRATVGRHVHP